MSELVKIVDSLEHKITMLITKLEALKQKNSKLQQDLQTANSSSSNTQQEVLDWEEKYNSLKMANSMLGSNTNKTEAKLKINTLIRELDHCIAQLAE